MNCQVSRLYLGIQSQEFKMVSIRTKAKIWKTTLGWLVGWSVCLSVSLSPSLMISSLSTSRQVVSAFFLYRGESIESCLPSWFCSQPHLVSLFSTSECPKEDTANLAFVLMMYGSGFPPVTYLPTKHRQNHRMQTPYLPSGWQVAMVSAFMKSTCHTPVSPAPASLQSPKLPSAFCLLALGLSGELCLLSICLLGPYNVCLFVFYLYL